MQQGYNRNNNMRRRRKVCYFTTNKIEHIDFIEDMRVLLDTYISSASGAKKKKANK